MIAYIGQVQILRIGACYLFLPERALQAFAEQEDLPFLAMGQYMQQNKVPLSEIEGFYFLGGQGTLDPPVMYILPKPCTAVSMLITRIRQIWQVVEPNSRKPRD